MSKEQNTREMYVRFSTTYATLSKARLLENMKGWPEAESYQLLDQAHLLDIYSQRMAESICKEYN